MKRSLTKMMELTKMTLAGETEAGSVEVQPARDSRFKATNCRWGGAYNLPSHFTIRKDNSELCNASKNLIKRVPPKAVSLFTEGKKSLLTVKWICPIHAEPVQQEAQAFINSLEYLEKEGTLSDYSRLKHLKNSQVFFNYGVDSQYLRKSPFKGISINNLTKDEWHFITPREFNALIDHTPELRLKTLYAVMYGCGLRFGESIHLWWDKNIDLLIASHPENVFTTLTVITCPFVKLIVS